MPFTSDLFYLDVVPSLQFGGEVGPAELTITDQVRVISATPTDPGNNMQTYTLKIGCVFKNTGTVATNFSVNL